MAFMVWKVLIHKCSRSKFGFVARKAAHLQGNLPQLPDVTEVSDALFDIFVLDR